MKTINHLLWILFKRHYVGQIIRRTRDFRFDKIDRLDLEIVSIGRHTLEVRVIATNDITTVIRHLK